MARFVKEVGRNYNQFTPEDGPGSGSVTSVALTAPTGFTVTGSPIVSSGTLALAFTTGYGIPPLMTGNSGKFLTTNGTIMSWANIAGTDVTGAALTENDDTNVTMTLGGTPSTALLRSVSMSLGWTGQLAVGRGGTGTSNLTGVVIGNNTSSMTSVTGTALQIFRVNSAGTGYEFFTATFLSNPMTTSGDIIYGGVLGAPTRLGANTTPTNMFLRSVSSGAPSWEPITSADITGAALTRTNDTNIQVTLGGSASTALLNAASITMGWSGQLSVSRGGTGASTLTGVLIGNGSSAISGLTGTALQILRVNGTASGYEFFTATFLTNPMTLDYDMIYQNSGAPARLPGPTSTTKQFLTAVGNGSNTTSLAWGTIAATDISAAALTKVDDTNVTLTLGGTPATSLIRAVSLTLGWSGTLSVGRGGSGASTLTGVLVGNGTSAFTAVVGTAGQFLRRNLANTAYEFRSIQGGDIAGSELTFANDTNVIMTLGGSPGSALLQPVSINLGWTGRLAVSRGGTGASTLTGVLIGNGTSAVTAITGTAGQILRRNTGNTAYEFWSANYLVNPMTLEGSIIYADTGGTPAELFANNTSTNKYLRSVNGTAPTWEALPASVGGSGTTNYVSKWTSSTTLGDSLIYDNGTNVGIGTATPSAKLEIAGGSLRLPNLQQIEWGGSTNSIDGSNSTNTLRFWTNNVARVTINNLGNVGIGTPSATEKLSVEGSISINYLNASAPYYLLLNRKTGQDGGIIFSRDNANDWQQNVDSNGNLYYYSYGTSANAITLQRSTGNLGIGNTPSHKLDVNGAIGLIGNLFAQRVGAYTYLYDDSGNNAILMGNSSQPINVYYNTTHYFQSRSGTNYLTIGSTGIDVVGSANLSSTFNLTWGGAYGAGIPTITGTSGTGAFLSFYPSGSSSGEKMKISDNGQIRFNGYTSTSSFSGLTVGLLGFTSTGAITTYSIPGGVSGTQDYLAKFDSTGVAVANSRIVDNGTNFLFNSASAYVTGLNLIGDIGMQSASGQASAILMRSNQTPTSGTSIGIIDSYAITTGSTYTQSAGMDFRASQNWNSTSAGTDIFVQTAPDNTIAPADMFVFLNNGAVRFIGRTSNPIGAAAGTMYYNSSANNMRYYNGTSWITF